MPIPSNENHHLLIFAGHLKSCEALKSLKRQNRLLEGLKPSLPTDLTGLAVSAPADECLPGRTCLESQITSLHIKEIREPFSVGLVSDEIHELWKLPPTWRNLPPPSHISLISLFAVFGIFAWASYIFFKQQPINAPSSVSLPSFSVCVFLIISAKHFVRKETSS